MFIFKAGGISKTLEDGLPRGREADDRQSVCLQHRHAKNPPPVARPLQVSLGSFLFVKNVILSFSMFFFYFSSINRASPGLHPCNTIYICVCVVHFCSSACRNLRVIDVEDFRNTNDPIELFAFQKMISNRVDRVRGILLKR